MVSATDPTSLLLESQGYYYLHLVFFLMIQLGIIGTTSPEMQCVMMNKNFDYTNLESKDNWVFRPTVAQFGKDWKGGFDKTLTKNGLIESNVNSILDQLKWMHLACVILLFFAQVSCVNRAGTAINLSSVLKIITVPLYFFIIFRVEATIRSMRTAYWVDPNGSGDKVNKFQFANWLDYKEAGGSTCFYKKKHNSILWLWIEIYAFFG